MQVNNILFLTVGTTVHSQPLVMIPLGELKLYTILEHWNKNAQPRNNYTHLKLLDIQ